MSITTLATRPRSRTCKSNSECVRSVLQQPAAETMLNVYGCSVRLSVFPSRINRLVSVCLRARCSVVALCCVVLSDRPRRLRTTHLAALLSYGRRTRAGSSRQTLQQMTLHATASSNAPHLAVSQCMGLSV